MNDISRHTFTECLTEQHTACPEFSVGASQIHECECECGHAARVRVSDEG